MTAPQRDAPALGPPIAFTLRAGTLVAVAGLAVGYLIEVVTGESASGNVIELVSGGGAGAFIGAGFLVLTLTPLVALAVAAVVLIRRGERGRGLVAVLAFGLLLASLVAAAVVGGSS